MDDNTFLVAGILANVLAGVVLAGVWGIAHVGEPMFRTLSEQDMKWNIKIRKVFVPALICNALLGWILWPWICYGVYSFARWNVNQINYVERPPVVEPADQEYIKAKHGVEK